MEKKQNAWKRINNMARWSKIHWCNKFIVFQEYEEDKKHGKGIFEWSDGRKYIGTWI